jgi:chromosome segregation ATPase
MLIYSISQTQGREDLLRQELQSLQGRLAAAEARAAEVSTTIAEATTPLVRQIEALHQAHSHALQEQHRIERALTDRIKEEEERAEEAHSELQRAHDAMAKMVRHTCLPPDRTPRVLGFVFLLTRPTTRHTP